MGLTEIVKLARKWWLEQPLSDCSYEGDYDIAQAAFVAGYNKAMTEIREKSIANGSFAYLDLGVEILEADELDDLPERGADDPVLLLLAHRLVQLTSGWPSPTASQHDEWTEICDRIEQRWDSR